MSQDQTLEKALVLIKKCAEVKGFTPKSLPRREFRRWQKLQDSPTKLTDHQIKQLGGWTWLQGLAEGERPDEMVSRRAQKARLAAKNKAAAEAQKSHKSKNTKKVEEPEEPTHNRRVREATMDDLIWDDGEDTLVDRTSYGKPQCFVITWAQNATPVHDNFLASLLHFCEHRDAKLVVVPGRYRNPTSIWSQKDQEDDWWDLRLDPYIRDDRPELAKDLIVYADVSIQPTAVRPLTGWEASPCSSIFGHPKIQLRPIPSSVRGKPKILVSTGAITYPNYTRTKAGKKALQHHVFGAALVEVVGDTWHLRQINADDDGVFTDLTEMFTPAGVFEAERPLALVTGDTHVAAVEPKVVEATYTGADAMVHALKPSQILYHDLLDFRARNHHSIDDPDRRFERIFGDEPDCVEDEVKEAIAFVDEMTPDFCLPVVIGSNHDEAFDRWLRNADANKDPLNARFFHTMRASILEHFEEHQEWLPAFEHCYEKWGKGRAHFVGRDQSHLIADIECGFHGDLGLNGARASLLSYSKLGAKTVIGHSHTAAILEGCYQVGVSGKLDQGYNRGPSSWTHTHCVIYANGKRSLIFISEDGEWRGPQTQAAPVEVAEAL